MVDYLSFSGRPVNLNGPHMTSFNGASMSYVEGFMAAVKPTMTAGIPEINVIKINFLTLVLVSFYSRHWWVLRCGVTSVFSSKHT